MSKEFEIITARIEDTRWREAMRRAGAFLASFKSPETRRGYQRDLHCWFAFCATHDLHPYRGGAPNPHRALSPRSRAPRSTAG